MKQKEVDTIVKLKEEAEKTQLKIIKLNKKINTKYWHKVADYWCMRITKAKDLDEVFKSKDYLKYEIARTLNQNEHRTTI